MVEHQIKRIMAYAVIPPLFLWLFAFTLKAWGSEAMLELRVAGKTMVEVSLTELQTQLDSHRIRFLNPLSIRKRIIKHSLFGMCLISPMEHSGPRTSIRT